MSEYDHGLPGLAQQAGRRCYQVRVGLHRFRGRGWRKQLHVFLQTHDIGRHLQGDRARASGIHFPESLVDQARGLRRRFDTFCPFCQALQYTKLIRDFMQETDTFPYPFRWDLSGQAQHPFITCISGTQG